MPDLRVNGDRLGLTPSSVATIAAGRLDAELHAATIPPAASDWALAPPFLYFRAVHLPSLGVPLHLTVDDELLDDYDIGLYVGTHSDIVGDLTLDAESLRFEGTAAIDATTVWSLEVTAALVRQPAG